MPKGSVAWSWAPASGAAPLSPCASRAERMMMGTWSEIEDDHVRHVPYGQLEGGHA